MLTSVLVGFVASVACMIEYVLIFQPDFSNIGYNSTEFLFSVVAIVISVSTLLGVALLPSRYSEDLRGHSGTGVRASELGRADHGEPVSRSGEAVAVAVTARR
jgi:hypothetical protein